MNPGDTTRRRADGSIDFDFYRADAAALRRRARAAMVTPRNLSLAAALAVGGAVCALVLVQAPAPHQGAGHPVDLAVNGPRVLK
jgi:hypothetical protein